MNAIDHAPADAYLDVELDGLQLIEASAGTGKTFTLATLVVRLVVERGLRLGEVLAVTFTDAATQELRARLRRRLIVAADIARSLASETDPDASAGAEPDPEAALTRAIIERRLQHEPLRALLARLERATLEIDLAPVFTIHGFCARVLAEHALHTGQPFDPAKLVASDREWREEIAADLWRVHGADALGAELLHVLWKRPAELADDLGALLGATRVLPEPPPDVPDPTSELQQAFTRLCSLFHHHGDEARAALDAAIAAKHIDGRKARSTSYEKAWASLTRGVAGACLDRDDDHLDKLTTTRLRECAKVGCEDKLPASPLFDALSHWFEVDQRRRHWLSRQALTLLHRIREDARGRMAHLKRVRRVQGYDDLIAGVADALAGEQGADLVRSLRAQYAVALVDEFQDTDPRQWAIFRRIFAGTEGPPSLFLIGDPKQAIYGFRGGDVHTYLAARQDARLAPPLSHNFRSRPSVLRAVEALYNQAGEEAFVDPRIRFHPVQPGGRNDDTQFLRDGKAATALTVRVLPPAQDAKPHKADDSKALATGACVAEIHAMLSEAREGRAELEGRPVRPGDIAVLVRSHKEATRVQSALAQLGIPAVAAGRQSLFETEQAGEVLAVLEAALHPADDGRLRAALSTVLLGVDAAGIDRLDHDGEWQRSQQMLALAWHERWKRQGPLALVSDLCATHAERLLGLADGERRLTNLLQLGEFLQDAEAHALGLHGLVDWLRGRIAGADPSDDQQLLRLESDAGRVQIMTLHKSKGLEFPLVFLPFVGIGRKPGSPARHCEVVDESGRALHWKAGSEEGAWQAAASDWQDEQRAEDARLLYVGLTRARHGLWLACGPLFEARATALAPMVADLEALAADDAIRLDRRPPQALPRPLAPEPAGEVPAARRASRSLPRDWWVYSFTQLSKSEGGEEVAPTTTFPEERAADDEPGPALPPAAADTAATEEAEVADRRFSGSRFGNVLHEALEHVDFAAWRDWRETAAPPGQDAPLRAALRTAGYPDADLDDGVAELTRLVGRTLTAPLPEGGRLADLPADARRAELEFHFSIQPTSVPRLLKILHGHGVVPAREGFGPRRQLEGLMTGKIDLTYTRDGRWYLLDYKSNRLPAYDTDGLAAAMAHSEYDLQALVYTLALHRWLRFRLGSAYDYGRDFGGVRYVFSRGLGIAGEGVHAHVPPAALVEALDRLFDGVAA